MKIEHFAKTTLIYQRRTGPYGGENRLLMEQFKDWLKVNRLFKTNSVILAISQDNPAITLPEHCRYDVGLVITDTQITDFPNIEKQRLAARTYAVFTIEHTASAINQMMQTMFSEVKNAGYQINSAAPIIERYPVALVQLHKCQICVPITN